MTTTDFDTLVNEALHAAFSGWDFSYIEPQRWRVAGPSWDYPAQARAALATARSALDLGTGGGEMLASLAPFPPRMVATEGWDENAPVAARRLLPLGVPVIRCESQDPAPFRDAAFDLIVDRHKGYNAREVKRLLTPGGRFITQQVGGRNNAELNEILECPIPFEFAYWTPEYAVAALEAAGMTIERVEEEMAETHVTDIGAVVYYLRVINWQIADFTPEGYRDRMLALHQRMEREGGLWIHDHRFFIVARA
jgi:SAM-dependent methyltransferase